MRSFLNRTLIALIFSGLSFSAGTAQTTGNHSPLTNAAIVKLVRAGFKEKTILSIITASPPAFELSPDRMIELKRNGVSERIILQMLARQEVLALNDDTWTDDPFFNQSAGKQKENQKSGDGSSGSSGSGGNNGNSTDIFGSSGGASGSTRSRGGNSSGSTDTQTTGSATVRIIRPPVEGGAAPKLEKTSSLTNDSIVELVEAGFSEGTIIRRIERSPVEFDLSPAKLNDLRKHSVSEKVLAAMRAAMGDDSNTSKTGPISNGTQ